MNKKELDKKQFLKWCVTGFVCWSLLLVGSLYLVHRNEWQDVMLTGRAIGLSFIQKDYIYRAWNSKNGGVYVAITDETKPARYLSHIPDRDITTEKGKRFTLISPAYMNSLVQETGKELYGFQSHITGLNMIRTDNKPDQWEKNALQEFEQGAKEAVELVTIDGLPYMRVMLPIEETPFCRKYHAEDDSEEEGIRGGMGALVPMQEIISSAKEHMLKNGVYLLVVFVLGYIGLFMFFRQTGRQLDTLIATEERLEIQGNYLFSIVDNISSGIAVYDVDEDQDDFIIKSINHAGLKSAQLKLGDVVGKRVTEVFPGFINMGLLAVFKRVSLTGEPEQYPTSIYNDERISFWCDNYVFKLPTGEIVAVYDDVTERKYAEEQLLNKTAEWEKTFAAIPDIVTLMDRDMKIIRANQAASDFFQIPPDKLTNMTCYSLFRGSSDPCRNCPGIATVDDFKYHTGIIEHKSLAKFFQVSSAPVLNSKKDVDYFVYVAQDITKQKQSEEEMLLFHELVNQSNDAIYVIDPHTSRYLYSNRNGYEKLGYTEEEFLQLGLCDIDTSLSSDVSYMKSIAQLKEQISMIFETGQRKKDGGILAVEVSSKFIEYEDKQFLLSTVRDISESKLFAEELFREKNKLESVISALGDGITIQDTNFKVLYQNSIHKLKRGDGQGEYCYTAYHGRDDVCPGCQLQQCFKDGAIHRRETTSQTDKGTVYTEASACALKDASGVIIGGVEVQRDITQRKNLEIQIQQAQKMEAIGTLAGGIAHDFNNILAAIIGYSEIAKDELPLESQAAKHIEQVILAGKRATDLVKQILTFSRKNNRQKQPLQVQPIVKEALKLMRASLPSTVKITTTIAPKCDQVLIDPTSMHQIVVNLCTNAVQAMEDIKGVMDVILRQVDLGPEQVLGKPGVQAGSFVLFMVKDSGKGMEKDTVARIFDPYFTTKKQGEGTGIGLAIVHGVVEDSHGFIEVDSTLGKGSTVRVYLPVFEENNAIILDSAGEVDLPVGHERILFIDDEPAIADVGKIILTRLGYRITSATNSLEAMKIFKESPENFSLVITDQTMPDLTGAELARNMLKTRPDLPIILCTGFTSAITEQKAYAIGIKNFVHKPLTKKKLAKTVRRLLDESSESSMGLEHEDKTG